MTERMPGFIADYVVDRGPQGTMLYVALQDEPKVFSPSPQSLVLVYQLSSPPPPQPETPEKNQVNKK